MSGAYLTYSIMRHLLNVPTPRLGLHFNRPYTSEPENYIMTKTAYRIIKIKVTK